MAIASSAELLLKKVITTSISIPAGKSTKGVAVLMMANIEYIKGDVPAAMEVLDNHINYLIENKDFENYSMIMDLKGWFLLYAGETRMAIDISNKKFREIPTLLVHEASNRKAVARGEIPNEN